LEILADLAWQGHPAWSHPWWLGPVGLEIAVKMKRRSLLQKGDVVLEVVVLLPFFG
jgi:hypothetical protein